MATLKTISKEELKEKLDSGDDFILVNVLSGNSFEAKHISGSINIDVGEDDFLDKVLEVTEGEKDKEIVVYCSSAACQVSPAAARKLTEAGYSNVSHYKGGVAEWEGAGYELEGEAVEEE